ncbi:hypothetical protein [Kribbella jiaozuonensis]|uniref:Uncharacterized protein n=1 Tax=Kribbella jiaozuonensis TaxID=2575441 RepID=A0A4U3LH98_9ACTN|nr:hypothetical protein [Kribbella jiaozuonensis]TKK74349.1 hypothetical protein FDA38_36790 [Kribbella jiaozuonensis]
MTATIEQPTKVRRPRATLQLLRITLVLHALLIVAQPIAAGYFLAGNVDAMTDIHATIGGSVWIVAFLQTIVAACYTIAGHGRLWPTITSAALVIAEFVQLTFGYAQNFAVHVPLGTAIVTAVVWMTVWSFRSTARLSRREAKR